MLVRDMQFNLLQEIIEEFIKRQKNIEEQIKNIEFRQNIFNINKRKIIL